MTPKTGIALVAITSLGLTLRLDDEGLRLVFNLYPDQKFQATLDRMLADAFSSFYSHHLTTREAVKLLPQLLGVNAEDMVVLSLTGEEPIETPTLDQVY